MKKLFAYWLSSLALAFCASAHAASPYRIAKIEGTSVVSVVRADARLKLKLNSRLEEGDTVVTGSGEIVEIECDDHSLLVVSGRSRMTLERPRAADAFYYVHLLYGKLFGLVRKGTLLPEEARRYKVVIRTSTGVMGVRGTRFVVESDEGDKGSTFRVIDGVVDIGKSITGLLTDNFIVAGTGQLVAAAADGFRYVTDGVSQAVTFVGTNAGKAVEKAGYGVETTKGAVVGVTDIADSSIHSLSAAMPFDVLGFIAKLDKQLPDAFHIPLITGEDRKYEGTEARYRLSSFELFGQGFYSSTPAGATNIGFGLSWNPTWHVVPGKWDLRLHVGSSRFFQSGHGAFGDVETKISASYVIRKAAYVEVGPLFRHFYALGNGVGGAVTAGFWLGDHRLLHLVDRLFFGTNYVRGLDQDLWEYRFGVGITVF